MAKAKRRLNSSKGQTQVRQKRESSANDEEIRQKKIIPFIEKLSSGESAERIVGIGAITTMAEDSHLRFLLQKERIVPLVITKLLKDTSEEVVSEAYGFLRNLAVEDGYDVAIYMYRQNILTIVKEALAVIQQSNNVSDLATGKKASLLECLENILGLLAALAPLDDQIFDSICDTLPNLPRLLVEVIQLCISSSNSFSSLLETNLELIYVLSDANASLIAQLQDYDFNPLISFKNNSVAVYSSGFLYNKHVESKLNKSVSSDEAVIPLLLNVLAGVISNTDISKVSSDLNPVITAQTHPSQVNELTKKALIARSEINAVQIALELVAAISETIEVDPGSIYALQDSQVEEDGQEDDQLDDDQYIENSLHFEDDIDFGTGNKKSLNNDESNGVIEQLLTKVLPAVVQVKDHSPCTTRALAALNNILWTLSAKLTLDLVEYKTTLEALWNELSPSLSQQSSDVEALTSILGCLWSISKQFSGQVPLENNIRTVTGKQTDAVSFIIDEQFAHVKNIFPEEEWVKYSSKAINFLAVLAMGGNATKKISEFLFNILQNCQQLPPAVMPDTLNSIFDIFGDKSYPYDEEVFVKGDLLTALVQSLPSVRKVTKKVNKKTHWQLRQTCDQAAINLARFIDYKRKERA